MSEIEDNISPEEVGGNEADDRDMLEASEWSDAESKEIQENPVSKPVDSSDSEKVNPGAETSGESPLEELKQSHSISRDRFLSEKSILDKNWETTLTKVLDPIMDSSPGAMEKKKGYEAYNFRRPDKLSRDQIRKIKTRFKAVARYMTNYLAEILSCRVFVEFIDVDQKYYNDMIKKEDDPMVIGIYGISPTNYRGVVRLSTNLFNCIIERMFGGSGTTKTAIRAFTQFEKYLSKEIFEKFLEFHNDMISDLVEVEPDVDQIDTDPLLISKTQSDNEVMVRFVYAIEIKGINGWLDICFPYNFLGPFFSRYSGGKKKVFSGRRTLSREGIKRSFGSMMVPIFVEFERRKISAREMASLSPGKIIKLAHTINKDLNIVVNGRIKFLGKAGTKGKKMRVKISSVHENED